MSESELELLRIKLAEMESVYIRDQDMIHCRQSESNVQAKQTTFVRPRGWKLTICGA